MHYNEVIFSGELSNIYRSVVDNTWMVVEHDGPWHYLNTTNVHDIGIGKNPRSLDYATKTIVPADILGSLSKLDFVSLIESLGAQEKYSQAISEGNIFYKFINYYPSKRILEFGVAADIPIPTDAQQFSQSYVNTYFST